MGSKYCQTWTVMTGDSTKRARGRPKTFDRERVIDTAMDCYWRDGTDGVSLNDLCRRASVSKPGVYREFGGEDGLMDAVHARYADVALRPMLDQIAQDRPFADVLAALVGSMTEPDRSKPAGCLLVKMCMLSSRLGPVTQARVDALRDQLRATYGRWVDQARERGEITTDVSTEVVAAFIDTQFMTLLTQMTLGEDPQSLRAQAALAFAGLTGGAGESM